ncbi:MAG: hypothetical protein NC548_21220 [Lachnospiraceae bacterium]|nr:hypothetical protein [Lachnospiraceae bacterium]
MSNIEGYKLKKTFEQFQSIRDLLDEKMYIVLKEVINNKFTSVEDFEDLINDDFKTILDDTKVRHDIEQISDKPICILYIHDNCNYIQFFNFDRYYGEIMKVLIDSGCIEDFRYVEGIEHLEYRLDVWKDIFNNFERTPVDSGFIVNMLSEKILSKLSEYLYRKYYELNRKENPEK